MTLSSYSENVSYHQVEINSNDEYEVNTLFDKLEYKIVSSMTKRAELNIPIKEIAKKTKIPVKFIKWIEKLSSMMMISLVGYGITGANVSMAYFDLYFSMIGIAFVLKNRLLPAAIAKKEVEAGYST